MRDYIALLHVHGLLTEIVDIGVPFRTGDHQKWEAAEAIRLVYARGLPESRVVLSNVVLQGET